MNGRGNPPGFDAVVARFNLAREAGRPACVTGAEVAQAIECMQLRPTAAAIGALVEAAQIAILHVPGEGRLKLAAALAPFTGPEPPTWCDFARERWGPAWYVAKRRHTTGRYADQPHVTPTQYGLGQAEYERLYGRSSF